MVYIRIHENDPWSGLVPAGKVVPGYFFHVQEARSLEPEQKD